MRLPGVLLLSLFFFHISPQVIAAPAPDITVNGLDAPGLIVAGNTVLVQVSLQSNELTKTLADWWAVGYSSSFGWSHFDLNKGWQTGLLSTYQGELLDLPQYTLLDTSSLPPDTYQFYFGVDTKMNGELDMDSVFYDSVEVIVTPTDNGSAGGDNSTTQNYWAVDDSNQSATQDGTSTYPYRTVQAAIDAASSGDSIRVAAGLYKENVRVSNKTLHLYGGYPGAESTDYTNGVGGNFSSRSSASYESHLQGNSSAPVVLFILEGASGSSVDGFRISDGQQGVALDTTETWPFLSQITISNNSIENNRNESGFGGGIFIQGSNITVENNLIRNNQADRGAGIAGSVVDLLLTQNRVLDNQVSGDHGGGIFITGSGKIDANLIEGNDVGSLAGYGWGGGMVVADLVKDDNGDSVTTPMIVSNNTFTGNYAKSYGGGIFIDDGARAQLSNNLITNNTSGEGGAGIYIDGAGTSDASDLRSEAEITNCTVANNLSAGYQGNGLMVQYSDVTVRNSIFWGNGDDFLIVDDEHPSLGTLAVSYSLSQEAISGSGNLNTDPQFVSSANNDYHLQSIAGHWDETGHRWIEDSITSPAIDTGDPAFDWSTEPTPNGSRLNMGTYGNTSGASKSAGDGLGGWWRPAPGVRWQWQLSGNLDQSVDVEMYDIDLMEVSASEIASLKTAGRKVICYFSAGSWEAWRDDISLIPEASIGSVMDGWPDERWLDISDIAALEPVMTGRLDAAVTNGCDGVEPDNVDGYQNQSGFDLSANDQLLYNQWLATQAHQRGLSIGLKNDLDQIVQLEPYFDWALNEQCFEMAECGLLAPFIAAGKAVFGVEYNLPTSEFCSQANSLNFDWLLKNLALDATRQACR